MDILIDSHAHLNFDVFNQDREKIINECLNNNVWVINIGTNYFTSKKAVEIAENYQKGVWAAIGLHPMGFDTGLLKLKKDSFEGGGFEKEFALQKYKRLAESDKVVAIGEIGLDYYWRPKGAKKRELFKEKQKELLLKQLDLADDVGLAVIFHCRLAHNDLIEVLKERKKMKQKEAKGVVHSFVGSIEQARKYLKMGLYLGFNGMIFKTIEGISFEEIIKYTPIERILIETDSPYLIPPEARDKAIEVGGLKVNQPLFVKYVAKEIARIKKISYEKVREKTMESAEQLFNLK